MKKIKGLLLFICLILLFTFFGCKQQEEPPIEEVIYEITYNLNDEPSFWNNIETEHEIKFKEQGVKIKAGIFKLRNINI